MPRANRHHLPHHVWHITHRCHRQQFLLKFARDRQALIRWLYAARRRFGLCVLDYAVTSNHIHLLVRDQGRGEIARSMQFVAGRTAQAYNERKSRHGAFWEDRYHATAVEGGEHLARCVVYIDLNMVRAGVVRHPAEWKAGGYHEIQLAPARYRIVDRAATAEVLDLEALPRLATAHAEWIEPALRERGQRRVPEWSESLAVGSRTFVERVGGGLLRWSDPGETAPCRPRGDGAMPAKRETIGT
jgi:REP-associated tyrosine transposase